LFSEDFKAWFNQFGTQPSEWFKTCFLWLRRDAGGVPIPTWVMEYVMGFSMYPSSGIAQRFSHALLWVAFQRSDASEGALLDAETDPLRVQYLQDRAALGPNQRVLWDADYHTDGTYLAVVGAARAARMLMTWGGVTTAVGAITKAIKRQAGSCVLWNTRSSQTRPSRRTRRCARQHPHGHLERRARYLFGVSKRHGPGGPPEAAATRAADEPLRHVSPLPPRYPAPRGAHPRPGGAQGQSGSLR
jgi:hypothetical protein